MAEHIKGLARAHQSLIWSRQRQTNTLRSMLREFYPAALAGFSEDLAGRDALAVLSLAPGPEQGRVLSVSKIGSALRRAGRQRNIETRAQAIQAALRTPQLAARPGVVSAYAATVRALRGHQRARRRRRRRFRRRAARRREHRRAGHEQGDRAPTTSSRPNRNPCRSRPAVTAGRR
jgi:hypothetical protein